MLGELFVMVDLGGFTYRSRYRLLHR